MHFPSCFKYAQSEERTGKRQKPSSQTDRSLAEDNNERATKRPKLMEAQSDSANNPSSEKTEVVRVYA